MNGTEELNSPTNEKAIQDLQEDLMELMTSVTHTRTPRGSAEIVMS